MSASHRDHGRLAVLGLIAAFAASVLPGSAQPVLALSPDVVISQVYGGGGNAGATYTHDYIELFNRGSAPASLNGWSVQYTSPTGVGNFGSATTLMTELPNVSLAAGQYYLIQESTNAPVGAPLPAADLVDATPILMGGASGKVALARTQATLGCNGSSTACSPAALALIVDLVGYGSANFFEGSAAAPELSATTAALRGAAGCTETDQNGTNFTAGAPNPRNTAAPLHVCGGGDVAPTVTTVVPAAGATGVSPDANLTITFSEAVDVAEPWFTVACATSGSHAAAVSGGPTTFTLDPADPFVGNETCTLTVLATGVSDADESDPPDTLAEDVIVGFTIASTDPCADPFTPIYSIQGSGNAAAITGDVTTQGVVVGDFDGTINVGLQGFYLQDATGDGNTATSDGIFVFTGNATGLVDAGDVVRVSGVARERFNQTAINGANNNTAPTTVIVDCGSTGSVDPVDVTLPSESSTSLERYEGMLVRFPQDLVIAEYFNYDQFGEIVLALPLEGEDRPFTGTALDEPGAPALARTLANSLRRITVDDTLAVSNPPTLRHPNGAPFSLENLFRGGDTVANTVGVLGFDFSQYRIQPTAAADYTQVNPRPMAPDPVGGTLRAAAMNTLNFFLTPDNIQEASNALDDPADNLCGGLANLECRGWDGNQATEFTRQRDKLLAALAGLDADIIGLNEIENTPGVEPLLDLENGVVAGLNAMPGVGPYAAINTGVIGTDAIRVGLIYRTDKVVPIGAYKVLTSAVDQRFIDTRSRPVLAQTFEELATGARITVAVNHLKSKGSGCGSGDDATDGSGNCNGTRTQAAEALVDWLAKDPTGSGDRDYLILGDLNSYAREAPIDEILEGADDVVGTSDDFTNLIEKYQGKYAHSYVFDGQAGYLDHALASPTLVGQVTGATDWHINSDESDVVDYDTSFKPTEQEALYEANPYRSSDHDPVIVGLGLLNFDFSGFLSPVDNPPVVNTVNAGRTIPMKFTLSGDLGLDVLFETPTATTYACSSGAPMDEVESTETSGSSGLTYDSATGEYTYAWNTHRPWAGLCRMFTATFDDGAYRTADFLFR